MKNNKAFTLIEIIGAVIILGILAIISVALFTRNLEGFREDFYINMESNLENSGKEFFTDNRKYRPNKYLESSKVTIGTLMGQKYIDDIIDYEGNECDKESYVIVIRKGKDKYDYHVCLKCPNDNYDNTNDNIYCDSAWTIPTTDYTLGDIEPIYVYKGTNRDKLIEKTKIPVSVIKYDEDGNVLEQVSGEGEEGIPYINPSNLDIIDTSKPGEYITEYVYQKEDDGNPDTEDEITKEGLVVVYENEAPIISITKVNNVATSRTSNKNESSDYGTGGTWAQQLEIKLNKGEGKYTETNTTVSKYQWKRNEKWIDFCTEVNSSGYCIITVGRKNNDTVGEEFDMNENVQFRIIDSEGNISKITTPYLFMIDNTNPSCTVNTPLPTGTNDWHIKDVAVSLINMKDETGKDNNAISGVKYYTIDGTQIESRTKIATTNGINHGTISDTQTEDTTSVTWYGFIEDNAQNYTICQKTFKKDATEPTATWSTDIEIDSDGTYHSNPGLNVTAVCSDATSGLYTDETNKGNISEFISSPTTSSGKELSITCVDNAGNTKTYKETFKVKYKSQSSLCNWNDCLTGENTCRYGCKESTSTCIVERGQPSHCSGDCTLTLSTSLGDQYTCTTKSNCSDCYYGHNTCEGGYETCWHY